MGNSVGDRESGIGALNKFSPTRYQVPVAVMPTPIAMERTGNFVLYVLALVLISATVLYAEPCMYDADGGGTVGVQFETMYDILPEKGFLPLTFYLENRTGSEQNVAITAKARIETNPSIRLSHSITIPARSSRDLSVMIPLEENWAATGGSLVVSYDLNGRTFRIKESRN